MSMCGLWSVAAVFALAVFFVPVMAVIVESLAGARECRALGTLSMGGKAFRSRSAPILGQTLSWSRHQSLYSARRTIVYRGCGQDPRPTNDLVVLPDLSPLGHNKNY